MWDKQIQELNGRVKVRIGPSKIHGVGLIALRKLEKGEKLFADYVPVAYNLPFEEFRHLRKEVRQLILERWPQIVNGSIFFYPDTKIQAYCNHSEEPNYDAMTDFLIRDVKKGDEITENYRIIPNYHLVHHWLAKKTTV